MARAALSPQLQHTEHPTSTATFSFHAVLEGSFIENQLQIYRICRESYQYTDAGIQLCTGLTRLCTAFHPHEPAVAFAVASRRRPKTPQVPESCSIPT